VIDQVQRQKKEKDTLKRGPDRGPPKNTKKGGGEKEWAGDPRFQVPVFVSPSRGCERVRKGRNWGVRKGSQKKVQKRRERCELDQKSGDSGRKRVKFVGMIPEEKRAQLK